MHALRTAWYACSQDVDDSDSATSERAKTPSLGAVCVNVFLPEVFDATVLLTEALPAEGGKTRASTRYALEKVGETAALHGLKLLLDACECRCFRRCAEDTRCSVVRARPA